MSGGVETATTDTMMCCASCGKAAVDDVKLKKCACDLVKYCSVDCQKNLVQSIKKHAKSGWLKYVMIGCSLNLMRAILENVRFAVCHCRLVERNG